MKLIIDVPDNIVPPEVLDIISGPLSEKQKKTAVRAFLKLALNTIDMSKITVDQYRLEVT